mgnify:FL=1|tara:strand:- start:102 stop:446 length:345 start_codon:yes stop_codon:yes gene_type:complete
MSKNKKQRKNIVYSTNPDYTYDFNDDVEQETLPISDQKLYVSIDRKNRGGKEVTLVEGFVGLDSDLKELGKFLKGKCGVGGTVKNETINIQGNHRDKVMDLLSNMGYLVKRKGG